MTTLLVASAGGHLQQLVHLVPRLRLDDDVLWVTYDTVQAQSLLQGERWIVAHHPTTKNIPNAIRNAALARRVLSDRAVTRVVSTGAAVAVPFAAVAAARGITCHYIESATRVTGPSLSGRILQRIPGVRLYRQSGNWGSPRWKLGPSVFDGFRAFDRGVHNVQRVLISLGTHDFPFRRLVQQLACLLETSRDLEVVWQLGNTSPLGPLPGRVEQHLPAPEFGSLVEWADVVVGHAGTGFCLTALTHGKVPILVPRRRAHREHTDNHQVKVADELGSRGLAIATEPAALRLGDLGRASRLRVTQSAPPPFLLDD